MFNVTLCQWQWDNFFQKYLPLWNGNNNDGKEKTTNIEIELKFQKLRVIFKAIFSIILYNLNKTFLGILVRRI